MKQKGDFQLPDWLLEKKDSGAPESSPAKMHFIRKTMHHISEVFENELFCEKYAGLPLLLQQIDPRIKLILCLAFMLLGSFVRSIAVLVFLAVIALLYAKLSGLMGKDFVRRVWGYLPIMVLVLSIPGATSLFVQGTPLFYAVKPGVLGMANGLYFSGNGIEMSVRLMLRTGVSLSFGFLLLLTTRWSQITSALAAMHVPLLFISVLNMAYRYIFVMAAEAEGTMEARYLRTTGTLSTQDNRRFMGHSIAHLFLKSHFLSGEIYDAMCCRGFAGKPVSLQRLKINGKDIVFLVNNLIIILILIVGETLF